MIPESDCRLCRKRPVRFEETVGDGIKTMSMMLGTMMKSFYGDDDEDDDDEELENGIQLMDGNLLAFDNSAREYVPLGIRISYCPLCGRDLSKEKNKEEET